VHKTRDAPDLLESLLSDPEAEWADMSGGPLTLRRLAKELERYGVRSKDIRIGKANRKGYTVAGDTGLAQAWERYLPGGEIQPCLDGKHVADTVSGTSLRDTNTTPEPVADRPVRESVTVVTDVTDNNGMPTQLKPDPGALEPVAPSAADTEIEAAPNARNMTPCGRPQPPGRLTPNTPGQTARVAAIVEKIKRERAASAGC
jgi:hypothetical protein